MRRRELGRNAWTGSIKRKGEMFKLNLEELELL